MQWAGTEKMKLRPKSLRSFLQEVEQKLPNEFIRVRREVTPRFEITAIVEKLESIGQYPILYFEKVKGSNMPVAANVYATRQKLALAMGIEQNKLLEEYQRREQNTLQPKILNSGPVKDIVLEDSDIDLYRFPLITHHEFDAGPYITSAMAVSKDPETGTRNWSFNRLQVKARNRAVTHLTPGRHLQIMYTKYEDLGKRMPIALFLGAHPGWALKPNPPYGVDEIGIMGAIAGEQIYLVKGETVDLEYPAYAEIALEGYLLPNEREDEGPFGEFTGYASGTRKHHPIHLTAICMQEDAIYHDITPGHMEHCLLVAIPRESLLLKAARSAYPNIKSIHVPVSGTGRFHCYVSIDKKGEGHPKNVGMAILGADISVKHVIIVDNDINVRDEEQVLWAIATRVQASRDITVIPDCRGLDLDPSTQWPPEHKGITDKLIIDATAKPSLQHEAYSRRNRVPKGVLDKIVLTEFIPPVNIQDQSDSDRSHR